MICVLTLFGETDLQPILKKAFGQNDIFFLEENCITSVQLTEQTELHKKEIDAVIIYSNAMNMEIIADYVNELRSFSPHLRIVLVLSGDQSQYLRSQINDYRNLKLDLIYDDDGFEVDELLSIIKKGKLTNRDFKPPKRESGFKGKIKSAMIYPIIICVVMVVVLWVMMTVVVPSLAKTLVSMGGELPLITKIVIGISNAMSKATPYMIVFIIALVLGYKAAIKNDAFKLEVDKRKLKIPIVGDMLEKIELSKFCRNLSSMQKKRNSSCRFAGYSRFGS